MAKTEAKSYVMAEAVAIVTRPRPKLRPNFCLLRQFGHKALTSVMVNKLLLA